MKDVTKTLERLEAFEDRLEVRLESLSALIEHGYLNVRGELHLKSGMQLQRNIQLFVAVYDSMSRVVATGETIYLAENFFGFEVFEIPVGVEELNLARICIYPKPF